MVLILGIETSCDENGGGSRRGWDAYPLERHRLADSTRIASMGGVFPEVASRMHVEAITLVVQQSFGRMHIFLPQTSMRWRLHGGARVSRFAAGGRELCQRAGLLVGISR